MRPSGRLVRAVALLVVLLPVVSCSKDPETAKRDFLARGDRYVEEKKLREAVIEYKNAIKVDARFGEARYRLADTYERLGDPNNAFGEFVRAADLMPDRDDVQLRAAQYLVLSGRLADASRIAEALLKKNAKNIDARIALANALAGLKNLKGAIKVLEAAVALDPRRIDAHLTLAAYVWASGNQPQAETILRNAIAIEPASVEARMGLVRIYWVTGDLPKTEALLREALTLQPAHIEANRTLVLFYQRSGRAKESEEPLRRLAERTKTVVDRLRLAEYYLGTSRTAEAASVLDALAKEPDDGRVPAALLLAQWDYAGRRREQGYKRLDDLLAAEPNNAQVLLLKAKFLSADGKIDEALTRAQSAAAAAPRLPDAQYAIGIIYLQKKDSAQAQKAFNEALKLDPNSIDSAFQIAKLQFAAGSTEPAQKTLEEVVRKQPTNVDARLTLARVLLARGDIARADTESATLVAQAPRSAEVYALVGSIAATKKNFAAARTAFARARELDSTSIAALAGLTALDLASGKPADARARIGARLVADPANPAVLEFAGRAYMSMGDAKQAEQVWRKLIEVQPSNMGAYAALGQIFYTQGRLDEARREFERYADKEPTNVGANTMVGIILQVQNRLDEAQKRYERTIEIGGNAPVAANNLAWLYAERNGNLDVALQLAQTAKRQLANSHEIDDTLGWVYYKKGLAMPAISSFLQSVARDPTNAIYQYHLGLAYLKNRERAQAKQALEKAISLKRDFEGAAEARRILATLY